MLVLKRRQDDRIFIYEPWRAEPLITITIASIKGNDVRIGIEAPESMKILRDDLAEADAQAIKNGDAA